MSFFMHWSATIVLFVFLAFVVLYLMTRNSRIIVKIIYVLFTISAICGFLIYSYSYLSVGAGLIEVPFAVLRGLLSTARMFILNPDYEVFASAVNTQYLSGSLWIQILFWICHVLAMIVMQTALIALFGQKLIDYFRLRFGRYREVYIIKGSDKNALLLGENIATRDDPRKRPVIKRLVVFLISEDDDAKKINEKVTHFGGIIQVLDRNHDLRYYMEKTRLGKRNRRSRKYQIILMSKNASTPDEAQIIAEYANEKLVSYADLDIFVFVSSEWDKEKIEEITQAKYSEQRKYPYTFHIVNETDLLIRKMIEKHPPFKCPGLNFSNGVAARDFTVMILGFETVGQTALLRLIMNGQFVGNSESRMRAIIVDRKINDLRDCFLHRHPSLDLCCTIKFSDFDVQCEDFYTLLDENNNVDYIVIASNSDEKNKQTAQDINLYYKRKNIPLPVIAVFEENGCLYKVEKSEEIFIFGCREEIYKESVIIREEVDGMAKAVNNAYKRMYGGKEWHELEWIHQESSRAVADFIPAMLFLVNPELDEKDVLNKKVLTDDQTLAETLAQTEHLRWNAFHTAMGYRPINIEEVRQRYEKTKNITYSHKDSKERLHVCLAQWNELDKISDVYKELEILAGKEPERDFKDFDRGIVKNIPEFLREGKKINKGN